MGGFFIFSWAIFFYIEVSTSKSFLSFWEAQKKAKAHAVCAKVRASFLDYLGCMALKQPWKQYDNKLTYKTELVLLNSEKLYVLHSKHKL